MSREDAIKLLRTKIDKLEEIINAIYSIESYDYDIVKPFVELALKGGLNYD